MADGVTYPGVYVREDNATMQSIPRRPTAVPAFLCNPHVFDCLFNGISATDPLRQNRCKYTSSSKNVIKVNNWLDFETDLHATLCLYAPITKTAMERGARYTDEMYANGLAHANQFPADGSALGRTQPDGISGAWDGTGTIDYPRLYYSFHIVQSLRAYFANGGGPCYLVKVTKGDDIATVKKLGDVTLLVQAGLVEEMDFTDIDTKSAEDKAAIYHKAWCATVKSIEKVCTEETGIFAILDAHISGERENDESITQALPKTAAGAAYGPWPQTVLLRRAAYVDVPPSAVAAGVYSQVDRERGIWKAPANLAVSGGLIIRHAMPDDMVGALNVGVQEKAGQDPRLARAPINVIRYMHSDIPIVWGARTLATHDANFRHISVRRLFDSVRRDVLAALASSAYEPNCSSTWTRARAALEHYLNALWKNGALVGEQEEDAYMVSIGLGSTMTQKDVAEGLMKVRLGLAAVRPAEFIILQFGQKTAVAHRE